MAVIEALHAVQSRIADAARGAGRDPSEVTLLPVSKFHPVSAIAELMGAGLGLFGENRLQELADKKQQLPDARFAMIGNVQRNKVKLVVEYADELHSLDSLSLAATLDRRLTEAGRRLPVLVQVNTSDEPQKSGIAPGEAVEFAKALREFPALDVRGLMTMAINSPDDERVAACFRRLRDVQAELRDAVPELRWDELSMGMSGDFELAITHGSTMVRVGTAIFGARPNAAV